MEIFTESITIEDRSYNKDASGYPALPTVFSGVEIVWGAGSCTEHPDPSRCVIPLWVPKTHETYIPALGERVTIIAAAFNGSGQYYQKVFVGKVEDVKLQDDHEVDGGYRINVTAADSLASAARLRITDYPWYFDTVKDRLTHIAYTTRDTGVSFDSALTPEAIAQAANTYVRPRDVDSFPALEAYQRTAMAAGFTVLSVNGNVSIANVLKLPEVLGADQSASSVVYSYNDTIPARHEQRVNGILNRTNWATGDSFFVNYSVNPGTGASASLYSTTDSPKVGTVNYGALWSFSASGGDQSVNWNQTGITGASGTKVSGGVWARANVSRPVKLRINLFASGVAAGTGLSGVVNLVANTWSWISLSGVTATAAYNKVEVGIVAQTNMSTSHTLEIDGVLVEKAATAGTFFDQYTLDNASNVVAEEAPGIPAFDASAIVDDVFELNTSDVVNEIKVEMKRTTGGIGGAVEDFDQIFTNEEGSRKTTPQTRSIETDWAIEDADMDTLLPTSVMVTKGKLLLAGQSKAQWRLSDSLKLVLKEIPYQYEVNSLLDEFQRFGALIRIDNGPSFVPKYMRVRGGRIVLGKEQALELDLEPVEYSAPIPLSGATLKADYAATNYRIRNFKTLTSNDLRTIGAR